MARLFVLDKRLFGGDFLRGSWGRIVPANDFDHLFECDEQTPLAKMINWVASRADWTSGTDELSIMCHGTAQREASGPVEFSIDPQTVHSGLQLCRENLDVWNVSLTSAWQGKLSRIVIYACGAAAEHSIAQLNNRRLCGLLARATGTEVFASDSTQTFEIRRWPIVDNTIDFGAWEGRVYRFTPSNSAGSLAHGI